MNVIEKLSGLIYKHEDALGSILFGLFLVFSAAGIVELLVFDTPYIVILVLGIIGILFLIMLVIVGLNFLRKGIDSIKNNKDTSN